MVSAVISTEYARNVDGNDLPDLPSFLNRQIIDKSRCNARNAGFAVPDLPGP
jgi:hypothetical protein